MAASVYSAIGAIRSTPCGRDGHADLPTQVQLLRQVIVLQALALHAVVSAL
jgi:hypothetical protein